MCWLSSHSGHQLIYSPLRHDDLRVLNLKAAGSFISFQLPSSSSLKETEVKDILKSIRRRWRPCGRVGTERVQLSTETRRKTISVISRKRDVTSSETRQRGRRISSSREQSLPAFKQPAQTSWFRCSPTEQTDFHRKFVPPWRYKLMSTTHSAVITEQIKVSVVCCEACSHVSVWL